MTYRLTLLVDRPHLPQSDPNRRGTITTRIAGCVDDADARLKAKKLYVVLDFKKIEPVSD